MKKIAVLDTNFLLIPYQFRIDIFSELNYIIDGAYDAVVPTGVLAELKKISEHAGKNALAARLALKIIEVNKGKLVFEKSDGIVDDWILGFAKKHRAIVCTNDKQLRMNSKKAKLRTVTMKSKSKLGII